MHCSIHRLSLWISLMLAGTLAGPACYQGASPPPPTSATTRLSLHVVDESGRSIENAIVVLGDDHWRSSASGLAHLEVSPDRLGERLVVRVTARGHTAATAVFAGLSPGMELLHVVVLHGFGEPLRVPADAGGVVERGSVRLEVPPNAFVDADGRTVLGDVDVTIVPLDPTVAGALSGMPGPLVAMRADTSSVQLEPVMMAEISVWQQGGRLALAPGKTARLSFTVPETSAASMREGVVIPAWWYDDVAGLWREEGAGQLGRREGGLVWTVDVGHFTWWNCDVPWTEQSCYQVTVEDWQGVSGSESLLVTALGTSYEGSSADHTQPDGQACVGAMLGGDVDIIVGDPSHPLVSPRQMMGTAVQGKCGGPGTCQPVTITLPDLPCYPGAQESCYSGPNGTEGVGICRPGLRTLLEDCSWSECDYEQVPENDDRCYTPEIDEDCDGLTGEAEGCICTAGEMMDCYNSDNDIRVVQEDKVGVCHGGTRTCDNDGRGWGSCVGMVPPADVMMLPPEESGAECEDKFDNNCNNDVNEGCACSEGAEQPCYSGSIEEIANEFSICKEGVQKCEGGVWIECDDHAKPQEEDCDMAELDEDCDGQVNESGVSCKCGDGFISEGEICDDGNTMDEDACPSTCNCYGSQTRLAMTSKCFVGTDIASKDMANMQCAKDLGQSWRWVEFGGQNGGSEMGMWINDTGIGELGWVGVEGHASECFETGDVGMTSIREGTEQCGFVDCGDNKSCKYEAETACDQCLRLICVSTTCPEC